MMEEKYELALPFIFLPYDIMLVDVAECIRQICECGMRLSVVNVMNV